MGRRNRWTTPVPRVRSRRSEFRLPSLQLNLDAYDHTELSEYPVTETPDATPPFYHDVLTIILIFVPVDWNTQRHVAQVCRTWRFFNNHSPFWQQYHVVPIPNCFGAVNDFTISPVAKPLRGGNGAPTRDALWGELKKKQEKADREAMAVQRARRRARWTAVGLSILFLILFWGMLVAMGFLGWAIGYSATSSFTTDWAVGAASFFFTLALVGPVTAFGFALLLVRRRAQNRAKIGRIFQPYDADEDELNEIHNSWRGGTFLVGLLVVSLVTSPVLGLVGIRTKVAETMRGTANFNLSRVPFIPCGVEWDQLGPQGFLELPSPLTASSGWVLNSSHNSAQFLHMYKYLSAPGAGPFGCARFVNRNNSSFGGVVQLDIGVTADELSTLEAFVSDFPTQNIGNSSSNSSPVTIYKGSEPFPYFGVRPGFLSHQQNWMAESNPLWADRRAYLINLDYPEEDSNERQQRVDHLYEAAIGVAIGAGVFGFVYCFLALVKIQYSKAKHGFVISCIMSYLLLSPLTFWIWGGICVAKESPWNTALPFAMCDWVAGIVLIVCGVVDLVLGCCVCLANIRVH